MFEEVGSSTNAIGARPAGRELDCKCNPVEPAANSRDCRRIGISKLRLVTTGRCAFHEKLYGG